MLYNYIGLTRNWVLQYTLYTIVLAYLQLSLYHKKQLVSVPAAYFFPPSCVSEPPNRWPQLAGNQQLGFRRWNVSTFFVLKKYMHHAT